MNANIFAYLKHEQQLLEEMVVLAGKQQRALINFDTKILKEIVSYQEVVAASLKKAEDSRVKMLMSWLAISAQDARKLKLSALEEHFKNEELKELKKLRLRLKSLMNELNSLNSLNRVLNNRAKNSINNMMSHFALGRNFLCNVKV